MTTIPRGVAPSILSADFARLGEQVDLVLDAGARTIHFDVMDGHFVPPITVGPEVAKAIAPRIHAAGAILDVHLMVERPERHVDAFAEAGADRILVQVESTPNVHYAIRQIRDHGRSPGVVINPGTPVDAVAELVDVVDVVLCMTVNPGWGGQPFLESSIAKLGRLKALVGDRAEIEVDGGVDAGTAGPCAEAGATIFVAGSAIFHADDPVAAFHQISTAAGYG
ncbi:ribulose-phosphate 3-epimerase [Capillimicrobium parvum]|uniref:Ribulose-phosphate 3-epimerase n=1 Tax=Capillimicrobium parvum TaxID=2884022 RepID=A0A9E6XWP6_9ACTN|nr:ribulose-phosphate 3-epimerase [Capillimicrobium parvum]UGS35808.1 Ribulose-phosphate 3-epimerase [Capillimicrobium parvum]